MVGEKELRKSMEHHVKISCGLLDPTHCIITYMTHASHPSVKLALIFLSILNHKRKRGEKAKVS